MKAISLWQPWASAIALGHKTIETRGWSARYRGPIAIHAAKIWKAEQRAFAALLKERYGIDLEDAPRGAIVATATVADIQPTEALEYRVGEIERLLGDYSPGRYGWILENIEPLPEPVYHSGKQGFFEVPDHLLK